MTLVPYDGYHPLREEGWLMEDPNPEPDDDAAEPENDLVPEAPLADIDATNVSVTFNAPSENDDDQPKETPDGP